MNLYGCIAVGLIMLAFSAVYGTYKYYEGYADGFRNGFAVGMKMFEDAVPDEEGNYTLSNAEDGEDDE